jgi:hypothetical protein
MTASALTALLALAAVLGVDAWVYSDARRRAEHGSPVVVRLGRFVVEDPVAWLIGCLVLFIVFVPLYVSSRDS